MATDNVLSRYVLWGIFFTLLGPCLFILLFPIGPIAAAYTTEMAIHSLRYNIYKNYVFTKKDAYKVTITRYIRACIPISTANICLTGLMSLITNDRIAISVTVTGASVGLGLIAYFVSFARKQNE